MQKIKTILLLLVLGITIIPWHLMCLTHPLGHDHLNHHKPTPCEIHKQFANADGQHILPPMECNHPVLAVQDYEQTQTKTTVTPIQLAIFATLFYELISFEIANQNSLVPPEPHCRSGSIISDAPLRGSPFI